MTSSIAGKTILITGAALPVAGLIGARLAELGAQLVVADADTETAGDLATYVRSRGGKAIAAELDASDRTSVKAAVGRAAKEYGRLDMVVNVLACHSEREVLKADEGTWQSQVETRGLVVMLIVQEAARQMATQGVGGKILNVIALPEKAEGSAFSGTMAAIVRSLTRQSARELIAEGIDVNCLAWFDPGSKPRSSRKMVPEDAAARTPRSRDLAGVVAFMASAEADMITGQAVTLDGGASLL